jgi:rRNA maturation endonuclease Nob1
MTTFVIDSNCFIHMGTFSKEAIVHYLIQSNLHMHITKGVVGEIENVRFQRIPDKPKVWQKLQGKIESHEIDESQIRGLAEKIGEKAAPQDVDVSLLVLSNQLTRQGHEVHLVTDDFKLANAATQHNLVSDVCPPSTFFERLQRLESGKVSNELKKLAWKIRSAEMRYAISRKDTYNIQEKLTWLIESLLDQDTVEQEVEQNTSKDNASSTLSVRKIVQHLNKYIRGGELKSTVQEKIQHLLPTCSHLTPLYDCINQINEYSEQFDQKSALKQLQNELQKVYELVAYDLTTLSGSDLEIVQQFTFKSFTKAYMLEGLLSQNEGEAHHSKNSFSKALFYTSLIDDNNTESKILGSLATIYISRRDYEQGLFCIQKSIDLDIQHRPTLIQRHVLHAICLQQLGQSHQATTSIQHAKKLLDEDLKEGANALFRLGHALLSLNAPYLAVELFDESIECFARFDSWPEELFDQYLIALQRCEDIEDLNVERIRELLDQIYEQSAEIESKIQEKLKENE